MDEFLWPGTGAVSGWGPSAGTRCLPTARHGQTGVFAFADGHAELWRWRVLNTEQILDATLKQYGVDTTVDLRRLQQAVFR